MNKALSCKGLELLLTDPIKTYISISLIYFISLDSIKACTGTFSNKRFHNGAGTGIGKAFALRARRSANGCIGGRREDPLRETSDEIACREPVFDLPLAIRQSGTSRLPPSLEVVAETGHIDVLIKQRRGERSWPPKIFLPGLETRSSKPCLNGTATATRAGRHHADQEFQEGASISAAYAWHGGRGTAHFGCRQGRSYRMSKSQQWGGGGGMGTAHRAGHLPLSGLRGCRSPHGALADRRRPQLILVRSRRRFGTIEETMKPACSCAARRRTTSMAKCGIDGGQWLNKGLSCFPSRTSLR